MIYLLIALIILTAALTYVVKNLLKKVELYEDKIQEYEARIILFQKYYNEIIQAIQFSDEKLKVIDHRGTFRSDDEVGYFFTFIKELQVLMNSFDYTKPHLKEPEIINKPDEKVSV